MVCVPQVRLELWEPCALFWNGVCVCCVCSLSECALHPVCAASAGVSCALYVCRMAAGGVSCEHHVCRVCFV